MPPLALMRYHVVMQSSDHTASVQEGWQAAEAVQV